MKLAWVSSMTDCEADMTAAVAQHPDISAHIYFMIDTGDKNNDYHRKMMTASPNIEITNVEPVATKTENYWPLKVIAESIKSQNPDLVIVRHPVWLASEGKAAELCKAFEGLPLVMWTWEWVPNIAMHQMPPLGAWPRIAVTNSQDYERCIAQFPRKKVMYFPFGVVDRTELETSFRFLYTCDLLCDAQPHYECNEYDRIKRASVDTMIRPALDLPYHLALWGSRYGDTSQCDWGATPDFKPYHEGSFETNNYPHVYGSAHLYLGVTWNWQSGGFSIRLARALGCGVATIWQETAGGRLDIPDESGAVAWSSKPERTKELIDYYMQNPIARRALAARGKAWGVENWEWGKQLKRLAREVV